MKILVVDDEALIREYIVYCIQHSGAPVQVIASVPSGTLAIAQMEKQKIDVLLTDITMPGMNGLELLHYVRTHWPQTDVVMLTCHADFSYARSALQHGVTEYILKSEMTETAMGKLLQRLKLKRKNYKVEEQPINWLDFGRFLSEAVRDPKIDLLDAKLVDEQLLGKRLKSYFVCGFRNEKAILDEIIKVNYDWLIKQWVFPYEEQFVLVIVELAEGSSRYQQQCLCEFIQGIKTEIRKRSGISRVYFDPSSIKRAILDLFSDWTEKFYGGVRQCRVNTDTHEQILYNLYDYRDKAINAFSEKNFATFKENIHNLMEYACTNRILVDLFKKEVSFIVETAAKDKEQRSVCLEQIIKAYNVHDVKTAIMEFTEYIDHSWRRYSANIESAIRYIQENFHQSITLQEVAYAACLNAEYFSRRFKKEVGVNYSEYLQALRLQKAKRMLLQTTMRVSSIAEQVGIPNVSHFSSVYKKQFGYTPAEERK